MSVPVACMDAQATAAEAESQYEQAIDNLQAAWDAYYEATAAWEDAAGKVSDDKVLEKIHKCLEEDPHPDMCIASALESHYAAIDKMDETAAKMAEAEEKIASAEDKKYIFESMLDLATAELNGCLTHWLSKKWIA